MSTPQLLESPSDRVTATAHAVADSTRRDILALLSVGEQRVAQIAENFDVTRPAISQHLRVLKDAGLVEVRPAGTQRYYSVRVEGAAELRGWIEGFWNQALDRLVAAAEDEQRRRDGGDHG